MEKKYILTAFSKDRPGIVADISEVIYENGCNLEDSTMTNMLDEFAIILLFAGKGEHLEDQLVKDCRRLEREKGITAFIRPVESAGEEKQAQYLSRFLADNRINIEKLTSRKIASPGAGTIHYFMEITVQLPENIPAADLEEGLSRVGEELNLEISVR